MSQLVEDKIKEAWEEYMKARFTKGKTIDMQLFSYNEKNLENLNNIE